ncbi:hypothetical protein [Archaeoglobus neptunius]|uniref:hypothetical protein n=1 Tax=Archaeoglobus neptunius TaxID=2798580 RepID=UPI00192568F8|nr:hypothetical protein [Archaeoglobus neptunius]
MTDLPPHLRTYCETADQVYQILVKSTLLVDVALSQLWPKERYTASEYYDLLHEMKKDILSEITGKILENYSYVYYSDMKDALEKALANGDTSFRDFAEKVVHTLEQRADEIALKNVLEKARNLLPFSQEPEEKMRQILHGRKLVLQHTYNFENNIGKYDTVESLAALHRLAIVVSNNYPPSKPIPSSVENAFWILHEITPRRKYSFSGVIKDIVFFKNGKLHVALLNEKVARKVAEALVYGVEWRGGRAVTRKQPLESVTRSPPPTPR